MLVLSLFPFWKARADTVVPAPPPPAPLSYCGLLHVPATPVPALRPKPFLGIVYSASEPNRLSPECTDGTAIRVDSILTGTPADKAGIRENDLILTVNGTPLCRERGKTLSAFREAIDRLGIGAELQMGLLRGTEPLSVTARLAEAPVHYQPEAAHQDIMQCTGHKSLLDSALRTRLVRSRFDDIVTGLYTVSNTDHNPGTPTAGRTDPLQLQAVTWLLRHPLTAGEVAKKMSRFMTEPRLQANWSLGGLIRQAARFLDAEPSPLTTPRDITFPALLQVMAETKVNVERALSRLSPAEAALLRDKALSPWDDDRWNAVVDASGKIDRAELFGAFAPLLSWLTRDNLAQLRDDLVKRFGSTKGPILYEDVTPFGRVIVGGTGTKTYREDAALILDLGGNALYLNNAGGTRPGLPVALVISWGGKNLYKARDNFSQGAGLLGGGFLLDLGGGSTFNAPDGSQGAGFWGVGLLYQGDGEGIFQARSFSQGVGQMGIGILANGTGNTSYQCALGGQGLGLFGGAGVLIDAGGNDIYQLGGMHPDFRDPLRATDSFGQGFGRGIRADKGKYGVPGGVGMLVDEGGNDAYQADYFAQGSAYYFGLGILNDRNGNDRYLAGRYAQGAGIHSAIGVLVDEEGDDAYSASFGVAQGMGHDFGVGFLEDDAGDDRYEGGILVQGAATGGSLGILVDPRGSDLFRCNEQGEGHSSGEDALGILISGGPAAGVSEWKTTGPSVRLRVKSPE
jgi:PDZ domain